jgi:NADPH2:quinone reductase
MRALQCLQWGPPESLQIREIDTPQPGPGEVRVRVLAAGVNFPDLLIVQGLYQLKPPLPFTPGAELAGEVLALGEGVRHLQVGQKVIGFSGLGGVAAGFLLAYGTSWHALRDRLALQAGETLLVLGAAGGVGLAAVEIAAAIGARVIAVASSESKRALCRAHGAAEAIGYEGLREELKRLTAGRGVDAVYDAVGGEVAEPAIRAMAWRGRYAVVGFASGAIPSIPLNLLLLKGSSLVGVFWGEWVKREPKAWAAGLAELRLARALDRDPQAPQARADRRRADRA